MRRPYGSFVVDTYVYLNYQNPDRSVTVRKQFDQCTPHRVSVSKSFSVRQYGSLSTAIWHAIRWRNLRFSTSSRRHRRVA